MYMHTYSTRTLVRTKLFALGIMLTLPALACEQPTPPGFTAGDDETEDSDDSDASESEESTDTDPTDTDETESDTDETDTTDTDETESDTDDPPPNAFEDTFYPLADGATWTYISKTTSNQILGEEVVEMVEIDWNGQQAFLQSDSPSAQGKWTDAVLMRDGDRVFRVHKEIQTEMGTQTIVDYDPGFMRSDDAWMEVDQFDEHFYVRTQTDGEGNNEDIEDRGHTFRVLAVDEEVTVPAGTFDTVVVERIRSVGTNVGERVIFWWARGVGKVREERPAEQKIEELASASIPDGVELP